MTRSSGVFVLVRSPQAAAALAPSLRREIAALDPVALFVATLAIAGATTVACWLPARRAARIDPMVALRAD